MAGARTRAATAASCSQKAEPRATRAHRCQRYAARLCSKSSGVFPTSFHSLSGRISTLFRALHRALIRVFTYVCDGLFKALVILRNSTLRFSLIKLTGIFFKIPGNKLLRGECDVGHFSDRLSDLHCCAVRFRAPCRSADRPLQTLSRRAFFPLSVLRSLSLCDS